MPHTVSSLIASADGGDPSAARALFVRLYAELKRLARRELARAAGGEGGISPTTLLHEAYLRMANRDRARFPDRARFMAYAARVMRRLIIDFVRSRQAQKRGGQFEITTMCTDHAEAVPDARELTRISDALDELAAVEPLLAQVVDLRFFCGFTLAEIALMRGVSERTLQRDWERARIFLYGALGDGPAGQ
jgi:RNA polymerase sigma factor (TIGR02999 family)